MCRLYIINSREVGDDGSDVVVAAKTRKADGPKTDGEEGRAETENEGQKRDGHVIVPRVEFRLREVVRVVIGKVVHEPDLGGG